MALADSPLIAQFTQREFRRGLLDAANKRVAEEQAGYEEAAAQPVALGPPPAEPDLMQRALATLGSNLATAASGREMFAERTSMAQMAEDAAYRQAMAQRSAQELEKNMELRRGLLSAKRDRAVQAADAAARLGDNVAAAERQEEALKATKELQTSLQEDQQRHQLDLQGEAHTDRMAEIQAELSGRLQQIRAGQSKTGNPAMDYLMMSAEINTMAATAYKNVTGKDALKDKKGFEKFKKGPEWKPVFDMLASESDIVMQPRAGEMAELWGARMRAMGKDEATVKKLGGAFFKNAPPGTFDFEGVSPAPAASGRKPIRAGSAGAVGAKLSDTFGVDVNNFEAVLRAMGIMGGMAMRSAFPAPDTTGRR